MWMGNARSGSASLILKLSCFPIVKSRAVCSRRKRGEIAS